VAGQLAALASEAATGALRVSGDPGGTIYLRGGQLAFAESAAVPDLGARLVNSRRLLPDQWSRADRDSEPDGCPGEVLLRRGLLDAIEWEMLIRSAVLDALVALALQEAAGSPAAPAVFTLGQARCAGPALRLDARTAWAFARQEAGRLARHAIGPGTRLTLTPVLPRAWPALGRHALAVLAQAGGQATIRQLAWRNGLALYPVMDWTAQLIHDGICAVSPSAAGIPPGHEDMPARWAPPDPELLARVLAGLRQLDTSTARELHGRPDTRAGTTE